MSRSIIPAAPRFVRSACLTDYVIIARSFGLDPFRLLREAGLDRSCLADPDTKIPVGVMCRLLENSAHAAQAEDFGLRMAQARHLSSLGPLALAMRDAGTLREALQSASRYICLHTDGIQLSLKEVDKLVMVEIKSLDEEASRSRQALELAVGVFHRGVRELAGTSQTSWHIWLSHSAPKDISIYHKIFGPQVEFGHSAIGLLFSRSNLDAPLPGADPVMTRHVRRYLDPMLERTDDTVGERLRHLLYQQFSTGRCSAQEAAHSLGMDRRTLHRHLRPLGETFSSIVDEVRSDLAVRYLEERRRPLSQVAFLLGFSASSAFTRWFRGRFSCSPTSWRSAERDRASPK